MTTYRSARMTIFGHLNQLLKLHVGDSSVCDVLRIPVIEDKLQNFGGLSSRSDTESLRLNVILRTPCSCPSNPKVTAIKHCQ
jgi:hypothetical protein